MKILSPDEEHYPLTAAETSCTHCSSMLFCLIKDERKNEPCYLYTPQAVCIPDTSPAQDIAVIRPSPERHVFEGCIGEYVNGRYTITDAFHGFLTKVLGASSTRSVRVSIENTDEKI